MTKKKILVLPAVIASIIAISIVPGINSDNLAFAETDVLPPILVADHLKNNPLAMKIIAEMEAQKLRYKQLQENKIQFWTQQPELEEKIKIGQSIIQEKREMAQAILEQDLQSLEKKYEQFTPKKSFARFVSSLNSTYHGIYWDQFDYLNAKVKLATAAKNAVLEDGGSFYEAQQEYFKYASMPRVEMINVIEDLNVRYGFTDKNIQSNFDADGKLPRFEDDNNAPCYECKRAGSEPKATIVKENTNDYKNEVQSLQDRLTELRHKFLAEKEYETKKSLVNTMNDLVKQIQQIAY